MAVIERSIVIGLKFEPAPVCLSRDDRLKSERLSVLEAKRRIGARLAEILKVRQSIVLDGIDAGTFPLLFLRGSDNELDAQLEAELRRFPEVSFVEDDQQMILPEE